MVSIVIPTLNEEKYLPHLLRNLKQETVEHEVIVADAGSDDETVTIARKYGAKVVSGGLPAVGRNRGAAQAQGDIIVFLDADTYFEPGDLTKAIDSFRRKKYGIAACLGEPYDASFSEKQLFKIYNTLLLSHLKVKPQFPGYCIFVKRSVHEKINGFDESIKFFEDANYTERAAKVARVGVVLNVRVKTSARRLQASSKFKVIRQIIGCYTYRLLRQEDRQGRFDYEFDIYDSSGQKTEKD